MTEIHALSGAYAVDAVDDLERAAFERHLAECAECRAEVASLRETAAMLAETTAAAPPSALRDRVLADITTIRQLPPEVPTAQPVRRHRVRLLVAAAAAVVLVGAGTAVVVTQPWADETRPPSATVQVLEAPDAQSTTLEFPGGASATVTHSDELDRAVLQTEDMPPPPEGKVYQVWLDQPGKGMVPAGVMPVEEDQTLLLEGDAATATGAGITVEPEGGSPAPTSEPIALFDFGRSA
ncbi:anti-sigma factor [Nocardioides sp. MAH-18]|uniref:Regulator of SigK n=1 Tax=Nocardioides agri TaxID=2682843 RepID=A0A6L6XQV0_9ACTN|nr:MULTISPECIES: anti-sigma factor [unclassified Nocardioides]MBA2954897.1 anti-sigma factor [Nocardioides sp. CGMCC 1.13656]MVQ49751.1 anti-sigma factor [Nocardioides sp. MAH-18]